MEKYLQKIRKFFTVKHTLIVIIGVLVLILIVQNVNRPNGPSRGGYKGSGQGASAGGFALPGMGGMGGGGKSMRGLQGGGGGNFQGPHAD